MNTRLTALLLATGVAAGSMATCLVMKRPTPPVPTPVVSRFWHLKQMQEAEARCVDAMLGTSPHRRRLSDPDLRNLLDDVVGRR